MFTAGYQNCALILNAGCLDRYRFRDAPMVALSAAAHRHGGCRASKHPRWHKAYFANASLPVAVGTGGPVGRCLEQLPGGFLVFTHRHPQEYGNRVRLVVSCSSEECVMHLRRKLSAEQVGLHTHCLWVLLFATLQQMAMRVAARAAA